MNFVFQIGAFVQGHFWTEENGKAVREHNSLKSKRESRNIQGSLLSTYSLCIASNLHQLCIFILLNLNCTGGSRQQLISTVIFFMSHMFAIEREESLYF